MNYYPGGIRRSRPATANPQLAGTGLVADDLYLIAHHELTGKPHLRQPRALGAGITGGLLTELLLDGDRPVIMLHDGRIIPVPRTGGNPAARYAQPGEPAAQWMLKQIAAEPEPLPVRNWLLYLGKKSVTVVGARLEHSGYLQRPASRRPWRSGRLVPADPDWAHCALLRAAAAQDATRPLTPYAALLAGLAGACGLGFRLQNLTDVPRRSPEDAVRVLPPALAELIAHVRVTTDGAVLSRL